uniref:Kinesin light chain 4 n=1 Tax=Cajanus cajan TaxID=3821 RepID=A0A151U9L0_CAJCA|nr:Kinesin light chain 4 [Cajanus cajan]
MFLRVSASNLLKKLRFPASHAFPASTATKNALPISFSGKLKLSHCYHTGSDGWRIDLRDPCVWIVISGHVAMTLGISACTVFAEGATTEASSDNGLGDDIIGLKKVEDDSVVSNIHTAKWRVFTDKAREGKLDEAEKLFLSAIQEAKEGFGEQDPHVASACNNLAELYRVKKAFDKAEPLYLEAINILEESFGPDDVRVGVAVHNLGQFYLGQRKLEEARVSYEIKRRVLGYGHSECSDTMYHLGVVLYLQGKETDAEAIIKDSIRMLEEGGEGESFVCIRRLRYLSQIYLKSHRVAEAEMVQRKILHVMELSKGWNSLDTVIAAESLALTLQASGNTKDSKELLERCLNVRKDLLPGDHIQIGANLLHLARVAMLDCSQHKKFDVSRAKAELDIAKDHLHNSIRIARQCLEKVFKQKEKLKKYSKLGDSRKEGQAALAILLQSLNTLSSVELDKQELQETQGGDINVKAQDALLQCISAYKEFVYYERSIADAPEIKNEYLSCLRRAQNLLGHKLDEELSNQKDFRKLNLTP